MKTPTETSPYRLMQEEFRDSPWKLLVGCICLNQVSAKTARPVWERIFERWPTWMSLLEGSRDSIKQELVDLLRPLGFQNRRAERILRMTEGLHYQYGALHRDHMMIRPGELFGCGKYAADSYDMFVKGRIVEDVQDKELKRYIVWARERHGEQARPAGSG